ncbi:hypothetical protein Tco_0863566 [Tanacetum coccineum]
MWKNPHIRSLKQELLKINLRPLIFLIGFRNRINFLLPIVIGTRLYQRLKGQRLAFNVSLRMFTRSIVIQRRVEDLQLGVKSYQKKLNLTKPNTYRSDLKRREAYSACSTPRGFIYHNKDKKNILMRMNYISLAMAHSMMFGLLLMIVSREFECSICHRPSGDNVTKEMQEQ